MIIQEARPRRFGFRNFQVVEPVSVRGHYGDLEPLVFKLPKTEDAQGARRVVPRSTRGDWVSEGPTVTIVVAIPNTESAGKLQRVDPISTRGYWG
ncbi:MAG: hypothetical protein HYV40_02960 [Candidatus Levybacteria bacterium]|nr:hypothetical protein [Candidatus Levybacteria bacterium]